MLSASYLLNCIMLNYLAGRGLFPSDRISTRILMGLLSGGLAYEVWGNYGDAVVVAIITTIGLLAWCVRGWGNGFMAVRASDTRDYSEFPSLCRLTDKTIGTREDTLMMEEKQILKWGAVYMTYRAWPLLIIFLGLAWFNVWALAYAPLMALHGFSYWITTKLVSEEHRVPLAQAFIGLIIGLPIILTIVTG